MEPAASSVILGPYFEIDFRCCSLLDFTTSKPMIPHPYDISDNSLVAASDNKLSASSPNKPPRANIGRAPFFATRCAKGS